MALFRKQTVDGIMSVFTATIDQLETLSENASKDVVTLNDQKDELDSKIATAVTEGSRATKVALQLRELIEG